MRENLPVVLLLASAAVEVLAAMVVENLVAVLQAVPVAGLAVPVPVV